jgi:tRNA threonylcarbamoyladenosine biosynthesis protein TsaE
LALWRGSPWAEDWAMYTKSVIDFISQSPEQTHLAGEHLGAMCRGGEVLCLSGALGCGKTAMAQGIGRGLGVTAPVTSPTYTVLKEYSGRLNLYHFDFYRFEQQIRDADIEFAEYLRDDAVCVIEWAEHAVELLPETHLLVRMRMVSPSKRALQFVPQGSCYEELVQRFQSLAFRP